MMNQQQDNDMTIDKAFEPYIKRVLEAHSFGVNRGHVQMNHFTSSGKTKADRFALSVPYAGQTLDWIVMFDSNCPDLGPDFQFHNDIFLADPDIDIIKNHIPSLANWQPTDPECLLNVLTELIILYKQYQINSLKAHGERPCFEYEMIIEQAGVRTEDIEILSPNEISPNEAKFFIRLDMDYSKLPGRSNKATLDQTLLVINFNHPNCNRIVPQLFFSPPLEATLGESGKLQIPHFSLNSSIADYLPEIKKIIAGKIDDVAKLFENRKMYMAAVIALQRQNVIEYDAVNFHSITILMEHEDFHFLVHVELTCTYPKDKPTVYLQSIYHMTKSDDMLKTKVKEYPYSPRWTTPVMVNKLLSTIIEKEVKYFKNLTLNNFLNCR